MDGAVLYQQCAVGTGKANTQATMVQANNRGGGFGWAAQACDALAINGFDDWFLPSRDELHYMYGNLHMRNLGGSSLDWYWSSTDEGAAYANRKWQAENFSDGRQAAYTSSDDVLCWSSQPKPPPLPGPMRATPKRFWFQPIPSSTTIGRLVRTSSGV